MVCVQSNVLMQCVSENVYRTELQKIVHVKDDTFRVENDKTFYPIQCIIHICESNGSDIVDGICTNCKKQIESGIMCKSPDTCFRDFHTSSKQSIGGFHYNLRSHEKFRDKRIKQEYHMLRENLWNREGNIKNDTTKYDDLLYSVKYEQYFPKSKFRNRRLRYKNRNLRYNLHPRI